MSVAYCFVCEGPLEKSVLKLEQLAEHTDQLNELLEEAELKLIDDFVVDDFSGLSALAEELQVNFADAQASEEQWFDASEGLQWIESLQQHMAKVETEFSNLETLLADIDNLKQGLQQAIKQATRWRFQVDLDA